MDGFQRTATGPSDLEPFWPSRQHYDFDRVCCRAKNAPGYGHVGNGRTVDVHVARLRRELGSEHRHRTRTVRRVGHTYTP